MSRPVDSAELNRAAARLQRACDETPDSTVYVAVDVSELSDVLAALRADRSPPEGFVLVPGDRLAIAKAICSQTCHPDDTEGGKRPCDQCDGSGWLEEADAVLAVAARPDPQPRDEGGRP